MHTEEQAKKTWCPKYRVSAFESDIDNRPFEHEKRDDGKWYPTGKLHPSCCCIASQCMWWRWVGWSSQEQTGTPDEFIPPTDKGPAQLRPKPPEGEGWRQHKNDNQMPGWTSWDRDNYDNARGFCGQAGEPK